MLSFIKKLSVVGVVLAASVMFSGSASAVPIVPGDPAVNINTATVFKHDVTLGIQGALEFEYNFYSVNLPQPAIAKKVILSAENGAAFTGSYLYWKDSVSNVQLGAAVALVESLITPGVYSASLSTLFTAVSDYQTLVVGFASIDSVDTLYNVRISAVPVPPALLLFGSSILGIGLLSRRRRRKTNLTAA